MRSIQNRLTLIGRREQPAITGRNLGRILRPPAPANRLGCPPVVIQVQDINAVGAAQDKLRWTVAGSSGPQADQAEEEEEKQFFGAEATGLRHLLEGMQLRIALFPLRAKR